MALLIAILVGSGLAAVFMPSATAATADACTSAPNWSAGTWYGTGNVVRYTDGKYYIAEHDNPGYDPTISTWYWDPYTCSGGGEPVPAPGRSWSARRSSTRCSRAGTRSTRTAG